MNETIIMLIEQYGIPVVVEWLQGLLSKWGEKPTHEQIMADKALLDAIIARIPPDDDTAGDAAMAEADNEC